MPSIPPLALKHGIRVVKEMRKIARLPPDANPEEAKRMEVTIKQELSTKGRWIPIPSIIRQGIGRRRRARGHICP